MIGHGSWTVADQGFFSLSNWLMQVLLANWLATDAEYGAFVVAFGWFLMVAVLHNSFVLEPLLVYGPRRFAGRLSGYVGSLITISASLAVVVGAILAGIAVAYTFGGERMGANALWAFAAAAPFILLMWTMRRSCYVELNPRLAALAGGGYMALMVGGMFAAHSAGILSVPIAVGILALSSILAASWLAWKQHTAVPSKALLIEASQDHWRFGRWAVLSGLLIVLPEQIYYVLLSMLNGQEGYADAGVLKAIQNLFQPLLQMITAFMTLLVPVYVRQTSVAGLRRTMRLAAVGLVGVPLAWAAFVAATHGPLISFLYDGRYGAEGRLVWLLGLVPVAYGWFAVRGGVLAARERPDLLFASTAAGGIFTVTLGVLLAHFYGLWGIALAWVISALLGVIIVDIFTRRLLRQEAARELEGRGDRS